MKIENSEITDHTLPPRRTLCLHYAIEHDRLDDGNFCVWVRAFGDTISVTSDDLDEAIQDLADKVGAIIPALSALDANLPYPDVEHVTTATICSVGLQ